MSDEVDDLDDFDDGAARPKFFSDVMLLTVAAVVGVAVLCVLSIVFVFAYVPETKGKSLEQIERELKD